MHSNMNKDWQARTRAYLTCQSCKVSSQPFKQINNNNIEPLKLHRGYRYLLTIIDRFSCWLEIVTLEGQTVNTVAKTLFSTWISRFWIPERITSDQGWQFQSELLLEMAEYLEIRKNATTDYHPQSTGLIERQYLALKSSLKCHRENRYLKSIPYRLSYFDCERQWKTI